MNRRKAVCNARGECWARLEGANITNARGQGFRSDICDLEMMSCKPVRNVMFDH